MYYPKPKVNNKKNKKVGLVGLEPEHSSSYELAALPLSYRPEMVPTVGLEPTRPEGHFILSETGLPISPRRHVKLFTLFILFVPCVGSFIGKLGNRFNIAKNN